MAEDLLSQLANPQRFAMLKERGAVNAAELEAQARQQVRVQEIRQSTFNNSVKEVDVQQTTLANVETVKEEIRVVEQPKAEFIQEPKIEVKIEEKPVEIVKEVEVQPQIEIKQEPKVQEVKPIQLSNIQPVRETSNSRMMHHESAAQIESIFKRLINRG